MACQLCSLCRKYITRVIKRNRLISTKKYFLWRWIAVELFITLGNMIGSLFLFLPVCISPVCHFNVLFGLNSQEITHTKTVVNLFFYGSLQRKVSVGKHEHEVVVYSCPQQEVGWIICTFGSYSICNYVRQWWCGSKTLEEFNMAGFASKSTWITRITHHKCVVHIFIPKLGIPLITCMIRCFHFMSSFFFVGLSKYTIYIARKLLVIDPFKCCLIILVWFLEYDRFFKNMAFCRIMVYVCTVFVPL